MSDHDAFSVPPADDQDAAASAASVQEIYAALAPERLAAQDVEPVAPAVPEQLVRSQSVDVLLVCRNGERWLPRALAALEASDVSPASVTAVDTGSTDATGQLLAEAALVDEVITLPAGTGFSVAVNTAADRARARNEGWANAAAGSHWVWVLHDDCAPAPDALRALLVGALAHDAAVVGPKVLSWDRRRQLVEMGVTITGSGRRTTGLEHQEYDQGQHDDRCDVLAVGSAGMLVRADAWDALRGFDPQIPLFREDVDFGWRARRGGFRVVVVPAAVLEHVEAAAHGRRAGGSLTRHPHVTDRRSALYVLLANAGTAGLLAAVPRAVLGSLLRAIGFVLGKVPGLAYDELVALGGALRPRRLARGRRWRRDQPRGGSVRGLRPTAGHQARQTVENLTGLLAGTGAGQDVPGARRRAVPGLADDEDDDEPPPSGQSLLVRALTSPGLLLVSLVTLVVLVAGRGLIGSGRLLGGALLPAPVHAGEVWSTYLAGWHPVGLGTPGGAPAYLGALALASLALLGRVGLLVDLLLVLAVPLATLSAWRAGRGLVGSVRVRAWAALTYGAVLLATGAIAAGRLGTAVAAVLAPPLARALVRGLRPDAPWRLAWSAAFLLALTSAFATVVGPIVAVTATGAVLLRARTTATLARLAVVLLTPLVLLLPWTLDVVADPTWLVREPGRTGLGAELADPTLPAWAPALLAPGGPGSLAVGVATGLLVLAALAWLRRDRREPVALGWALVVASVAAGVLTSRIAVSAPTGEGAAAGWPGPAVMLAALGVVGVIAVAADGLAVRSRARAATRLPRSPRRRLLLAGALLLAVGTSGVLLVAGLGRGLATPLERADPTVLPVYVAEESAGPDRPRTLVLSVEGDPDTAVVGYSVLREEGPRLGDADVGALTDTSLDALVGDLLAGRGSASVGALAQFGIRYLFVPAPADPAVVETLDGQSGLVRASAPEGGAVWRVEGTTARVRLLTDEQRATEPVGVPVASDQVSVRARLDEPTASRLVLAEMADPGWRATLDGEALEPVDGDGLMAFALPSGRGELAVDYRDPSRPWLLAAEGFALLVVVLLMLPSLRRPGDTVQDVVDLGPEPGDRVEVVRTSAGADAVEVAR
jgi:GT2 family glycosyltransferase